MSRITKEEDFNIHKISFLHHGFSIQKLLALHFLPGVVVGIDFLWEK